jgi:Sulfotransferase family
MTSLDDQRITGLEERIAAETAELHRRRRGRCSSGPSGHRLFIGGCPRSGTTALATFLNGDERFILGQERFRRMIKLLEPWHFTEPVFFNPTLRETSWAMPSRNEVVFPGGPADYRILRERWQSGGVEVLGDKAPYYHRALSELAAAFPGSRFVIVVRGLNDVAASYVRRATNPGDHWPAENDHRLAVDDWNEALQNTRAFAESPETARLAVIDYDRFYTGASGELERLYDFLGLEVVPNVVARYGVVVEEGRRRRRDPGLDASVVEHLESRRDRELEDWYRSWIAAQHRASS